MHADICTYMFILIKHYHHTWIHKYMSWWQLWGFGLYHAKFLLHDFPCANDILTQWTHWSFQWLWILISLPSKIIKLMHQMSTGQLIYVWASHSLVCLYVRKLHAELRKMIQWIWTAFQRKRWDLVLSSVF